MKTQTNTIQNPPCRGNTGKCVPCPVWPEKATWETHVGPPPAWSNMGGRCNAPTAVVESGGGLAALRSPAAKTGFWGRGMSSLWVLVREVGTRYSRGHLHAQCWLWNQTPQQGTVSCLLRSCSGWEAPSRCGDTHKPLAGFHKVGVCPGG